MFFEVPNVMYTLHQLGIWDIIYEHCSFFSSFSLQSVFQLTGFNVLRVAEVFNRQFLTIEVQPSSEGSHWIAPSTRDLLRMREDVNKFQDNFVNKVNIWRDTLAKLSEDGKKAVVWGAGSKGVTFLNIMGSQNVIDHIVDINPRKKGMFVAGSGQEIIPPEALTDLSPEVVIVMNPNYRDEIGNIMKEMGISAEILVA